MGKSLRVRLFDEAAEKTIQLGEAETTVAALINAKDWMWTDDMMLGGKSVGTITIKLGINNSAQTSVFFGFKWHNVNN